MNDKHLGNMNGIPRHFLMCLLSLKRMENRKGEMGLSSNVFFVRLKNGKFYSPFKTRKETKRTETV